MLDALKQASVAQLASAFGCYNPMKTDERNRKAGGSSPPRGVEIILFHKIINVFGCPGYLGRTCCYHPINSPKGRRGKLGILISFFFGVTNR